MRVIPVGVSWYPSTWHTWILVWLTCMLHLGVAQLSSSTSRVSLQTPEALFIGNRELVDKDRSRREYYAFTGIPYAKPPVGERRWQESELLEVEPGTHHATTYGHSCPQNDRNGNFVGAENCLFLNVYTPYIPAGGGGSGVVRGAPTSARPLLPVIVYIHGGGFVHGAGSAHGARRLMKQDVILVTINYRLGVLGYLSTGDGAIGGNFGSLDQITALRWVQKYIRGFGGNPGRVTIMGHSAGAASVHLLMLSPPALGLFHSSIIMSGSAFCDWAINENPASYAEQIGDQVGCGGSSFELASCLAERTPEELVQAQAQLTSFAVFPLRAAPVIDKAWRDDEAFLPGNPKELMDAGAFAQVPVISGVTQDEGLFMYIQLHLQLAGERFKDPDYFANQLLPDVLSAILDSSEPLDVTVDAVKAQYFEELDVENETKRVITELSDMLGDAIFYSCHWDMLERFAADSKSPLYSYVFAHKTPTSPSLLANEMRKIRQMGIHHPLFNYGVSHGDELFYLFDPIDGFNDRLRPEDERVSDIITRAFVSFATTGSPASGLQLIPNAVPWRPIKPGSINYYNLTSLPSPMGEDFRKGEALFWLRTIPYVQQLGNTILDLQDYPTYFWIALGVALFLFLVTLILIIVLWRRRTTGVVHL